VEYYHSRRAADSGLTVVSTLQLEDGVQFRVLGDASARRTAVPVEPSLEDGYIWLMQQRED
jgi:hypothetical protein